MRTYLFPTGKKWEGQKLNNRYAKVIAFLLNEVIATDGDNTYDHKAKNVFGFYKKALEEGGPVFAEKSIDMLENGTEIFRLLAHSTLGNITEKNVIKLY